MLFAVTMSMFLNDTSQFVPVENIEVNCKNYWWRNALLIQNLYPMSEMCLRLDACLDKKAFAYYVKQESVMRFRFCYTSY